MRSTLLAASVLAALVGTIAARGLLWLPVAFILFGVGAFLVMRLPRRPAGVLIAMGAVALPVVAAVGPPRGSDDLYRYIWDGRVQASGLDPYRYAPDDQHLAFLRDPFLWPAQSHWCVPSGCTLVNRPTVHTIYPPVAEALFAVVHWLSPSGSHEKPIQIAGILCALAVALFVWYQAKNLNYDPRRTVLWAWCPAVAIEAGSNAHIDVAAVLVTAVALGRLSRQRAISGGVLIGLAIATKVTPGLLLPAVIRRRPRAVLTAMCGAIAVVYLPHVLAVGAGVLGYIPGYLHEEGYADGARFALVSMVAPGALAGPVAVLILTGVAVWTWRTADPARPWRAAAVMVGAALIVAAPTYPWYTLLLVLLVAMGADLRWLAVIPAAYLAQFAPNLGLSTVLAQRLGYGVALVVILATGLRRPRDRARAEAGRRGRQSVERGDPDQARAQQVRGDHGDGQMGEVLHEADRPLPELDLDEGRRRT